MNNKKGKLYMITNLVNNKMYIGKTINTIERRWSQHLYNSKLNKQKCISLENAIRKYSSENFRIEILLICEIDYLDYYEINFIKSYMTNNQKFGYNICDGGGGSINRPVSDEHRTKISVAKKKSENNLPVGIQEKKKDDIIIGYIVSKNINNIRYTKNFTNSKNNPEINLELAIKWLENLNLGNKEDNRYNRTHNLPKNISYHYTSKKEIDGYQVHIGIKGKRYVKSFTFKNISMEEKLIMALKYKENIIEELRDNQ